MFGDVRFGSKATFAPHKLMSASTPGATTKDGVIGLAIFVDD
jgi:hypothetical protein